MVEGTQVNRKMILSNPSFFRIDTIRSPLIQRELVVRLIALYWVTLRFKMGYVVTQVAA